MSGHARTGIAEPQGPELELPVWVVNLPASMKLGREGEVQGEKLSCYFNGVIIGVDVEQLRAVGTATAQQSWEIDGRLIDNQNPVSVRLSRDVAIPGGWLAFLVPHVSTNS